ncbi:MAG TPA: hypothetical protein VNX88_09830 [Terriglobales bacterium]|nr:hypothetical protein [Terriglobales bacterium]
MYRLFFACVVLGSWAQAQVEAHFSLPKEEYAAGEPVLLEYTVRNAGAQPIRILSATPNTFCSGYVVKVNRTDVTEPHGCGGGMSGGSCLSSGRPLKPGESVTEHFMVNDHDQMRTPGFYRISAIRELPTSVESDLTALYSGPKVKTSAEFDVEVVEAEARHVRSILLPYFADLSSDDWQRRSTAEQVVGTLSSPAVEDLVLRLHDNPRTKDIAVRALAAVNTPATRKQLAEIALSNGQDRFSEYARFSAASALGGSGDRSYWPLLRDLAARQPPGQAGGLISSAARLGGEEALPWLRDLLRSPDVKIKADAVFPLALTGSRQAAPLLIDMLGDDEEHIPEAAQNALVQLTHHAFNPKQIVPSDTAAAHAAWIRWWSRNAESAPIYKPGEYCGNAAPLE